MLALYIGLQFSRWWQMGRNDVRLCWTQSRWFHERDHREWHLRIRQLEKGEEESSKGERGGEEPEERHGSDQGVHTCTCTIEL